MPAYIIKETFPAYILETGGIGMNLIEAQQIAEQFGLSGQCSLVRDLIKIETIYGFKCIRRVNYSIERLKFMHDVKEYLIKKQYDLIDRFLLDREGNPYIIHYNSIYVLTDWIEGRECNFDNFGDIKLAMESLAKLHYCSMGYSPSDGIETRSELGRLPITLEKRSQEMQKLKKIAKRGKSRFDYLFLENVDIFIDRSIESLRIIKSPIYSRLVEKEKKNLGLCHRDYSYHNLILNREGKLYTINFDYCCYELKVYDIASFLRKIMSGCKWNVEAAMNIINWYDAVNNIEQDEMKMIFSLLGYPQKFWRIANRYYNSRRTRPETGFYNKLVDVISEKEAYLDFLNKFEEYITAGIKG